MNGIEIELCYWTLLVLEALGVRNIDSLNWFTSSTYNHWFYTRCEQYLNPFIFHFTHYLSLLFRKFTSKFCVNYKEIRKNLEFEVMELDAKVQLKYISTIAIMPRSNSTKYLTPGGMTETEERNTFGLEITRTEFTPVSVESTEIVWIIHWSAIATRRLQFN